MSNLEVSLLRGFALTCGGTRVPLLPTGQRLVAYLAVRGRSVHRPQAAARLWPDATGARANANLRSALWRVQRACPRLVDASALQLGLATGVMVDLHRAHSFADRLLDVTRRCDEILHAGTRDDLCADVLPDWDSEEWLIIEREHYHQLRLHALESMCERLIAAGRHGEAVAAGLAAVRAEPLRESAHRAVIRAYLAAGNRFAAGRQYERCRRMVRDELGLSPSAELAGLAYVGTACASGRSGNDHLTHA